MKSYNNDLDQIITAAINSVKPENLIPSRVKFENQKLSICKQIFDLSKFKNIYVIGAGKASAFMAKEFEKILGNKINEGIISTKYEHSTKCEFVKIIEAGHPYPDKNSIKAGEEILELARKADEDDLVICLISGGGSALIEKLPEEISLQDLKEVNRTLINCGAGVDQINIIRKKLSEIKGGKLAEAVFPAICVSVILSDVIGDPVESIASGPTAQDNSSIKDALNIISKYEIENDLPQNVIKHLQNKSKEEKEAELINNKFDKVTNIIIGNNFDALNGAKKKAEELGYNTLILSDKLQGEARKAAKTITPIIKEIYSNDFPVNKPACVLLGGETTVIVKGNGIGGRNQEFVLSALIELQNSNIDFQIASFGTDGIDGPTDAAGAVISKNIPAKSKKLKLDPVKYLTNNDSYNFFSKTGGLIKTGPTGTNVMDIVIGLIKD